MTADHQIAIYGSTGSIGESALDIVRAHGGRFRISVLAAGRRFDELLAQVREFRPDHAVIAHAPDKQVFDEAQSALRRDGVATVLHVGVAALAEVAREAEYTTMLAAITGAAGLPPALEAARRGRRIALANKEALVMTGPLMMDLVARHGAELLPVDSEHSAIWQCLRGEQTSEVQRIILTASGGPFRTTPRKDFAAITRAQALKHPTWVMGPKITIDSATLMNKALEVIEARWLFGLQRHQLDAIIHPQSIVHSMVEFVDASIMAQLGSTDMKLPIQLALTHPQRLPCTVAPVTLEQLSNLSFEAVDEERFPALPLGFEVAEAGGTLGAVFSAANEVAVAAFLDERIRFTEIFEVVEAVTRKHATVARPSLEEVLEADAWARAAATERIARR